MKVRQDQLERLKREAFDLLVIGGGATGAGIALDAASRGLKVALVERDDFAAGTSSRSTKLIHGGVRYLEQAVKRLDRVQFNLVRDALRERKVLLQIAPHLARPLPLVTPLYRVWEAPYYWFGLKLYDLLAGRAGIGWSRFLPRHEALRRFPTLRPEGLVGGVLYYDGQFDDARMNLAIVLTALQHGAVAVNHAEVTALLKREGRVRGAAVRDRISGEAFEVAATVVINATGPFADEIRRLDDPDAPPILRVSSGVHLVLDARFSPPDTGLLIPRTEDGRVLFVLPWLGHTLVGTTDEPAAPDPHPPVREEEVEYLLRHVNRYFNLEVTRADIKARWSGLRPLVARPQEADTARLARDHVILESPSGLLTITGGKWTTYRKMAEDAVTHAIQRAGLTPQGPCRTATLPLVGAAAFDPNGAARLGETFGLDPEVAAHLHRTYGDQAERVAALAREGYGARLAPGHPYLEAEVVWAAREELAVRALDVLARRTRLAFLDQRAAHSALERVVALLGAELGWDAARCEAELRAARERLERAL